MAHLLNMSAFLFNTLHDVIYLNKRRKRPMSNKYPNKKRLPPPPKQHYRVSSWREYNESLRQHGQIDIWITEDALNN